MIAIESIQNLDGNIIIPTSQILQFKDNNLMTADGKTITLTGVDTSGTGGTGGTTPPPTSTEVQDLSMNYTALAIDAAIDNTIQITQDAGEANFSKHEFILTQNDFTLSASTISSIAVSKIKMTIQEQGYQICKILMYDTSDNLITFSRFSSNAVQKTSNTSIKIDIVTTGFTLVTNATYEPANIFNTDKLPVAGTSGWYAVTANTDPTSNFVATFSSTIDVAKIVVYRQGASSVSFNGSTKDYQIIITDSANVDKVINIPKVSDAQFVTLDNPVITNLGSTGALPDPSTKLHKFTLNTSLDGITFSDISNDGVTTFVQNPTTLAYTATTTYPIKTIDSSKLFFKIPDGDINFLNKVKVNMWRKS